MPSIFSHMVCLVLIHVSNPITGQEAAQHWTTSWTTWSCRRSRWRRSRRKKRRKGRRRRTWRGWRGRSISCDPHWRWRTKNIQISRDKWRKNKEKQKTKKLKKYIKTLKKSKTKISTTKNLHCEGEAGCRGGDRQARLSNIILRLRSCRWSHSSPSSPSSSSSMSSFS